MQNLNYYNIQEMKTLHFTKQTTLNIISSKTQIMFINGTPTAPVLLNGEPCEFFSTISAALSARKVGHRTLMEDWLKPRICFPNSATSGSPTDIAQQDSCLQLCQASLKLNSNICKLTFSQIPILICWRLAGISFITFTLLLSCVSMKKKNC